MFFFLSCFFFSFSFFFLKTKHQSCVKQHSVSNVRLVSCSTRSCLLLGHSRRAFHSASSLRGFQSKKATTSKNCNLRINICKGGIVLIFCSVKKRKIYCVKAALGSNLRRPGSCLNEWWESCNFITTACIESPSILLK